MEKKERKVSQTNLKRKRATLQPKRSINSKIVGEQQHQLQPLRRLHISDDESTEEEFAKQFTQQQNASKFHSRSRTMPRLNNNASQNPRNTTQLSTFQHQTQNIQPRLIDAHLPQINQAKKIPPKPPLRKHIRHDPEGIQQVQSVTAEFQEMKTFQLAVVQQTHKLALREVPKPPINFNHQQNQHQQQQHLLHQTQSSLSSMTPSTASHFPNILIFGTQNFHLRHQQQQQLAPNPQIMQQQQQSHQMSSNMPRMNSVRNQHQQQQRQVQSHAQSNGMIVANYSSAVDERSDPENHIYEMIDECEANGQQKKKAINNDEEMTKKSEHDGNDLFQNLLRTEMLNQLQLCKGNTLKGNNGFLSHLTHEKRMDIIQETALALASSAYVEKHSNKNTKQNAPQFKSSPNHQHPSPTEINAHTIFYCHKEFI